MLALASGKLQRPRGGRDSQRDLQVHAAVWRHSVGTLIGECVLTHVLRLSVPHKTTFTAWPRYGTVRTASRAQPARAGQAARGVRETYGGGRRPTAGGTGCGSGCWMKSSSTSRLRVAEAEAAQREEGPVHACEAVTALEPPETREAAQPRVGPLPVRAARPRRAQTTGRAASWRWRGPGGTGEHAAPPAGAGWLRRSYAARAPCADLSARRAARLAEIRP